MHLLAMGGPGLSGDGAHYALYGAHLAWSYFDHPPLVGWLQALVEPFSRSDFALRLWPLVLALTAGAALYRLTRELFPEETPWLGFFAVLVAQSGVIFSLMGLAMLPDDPLLVFFLIAVLALYRTVTLDQVRGWVFVGVLFGFAGLSKYTAGALVVSAALLVVSERRWGHLRTPWPWLGALIALLIISPVLWWNWNHGWISFVYQIHHMREPGGGWTLRRFALSSLIQALAYSPGIFLLGLISVGYALRRVGDARMRLILFTSLPVLLPMAMAAGSNLVLPHWTAVGWAVLCALIAYWLHRNWRLRWVKWFSLLSGLYSAALIGAVHAQFVHPWIPFKANHNPVADLYGWQEATAAAARLRDQMSATPGPAPVLLVGNWSYASHLAWYAYPAPVQIIGHEVHQLTLWYGNAPPGARGVLVVPYVFRHDALRWVAKFDHCAAPLALPIPIQGKTATTYYLYRCSGLHG